MSGDLVQSQKPVTLLGGGEVSAELVNEALRLAPCLVAADGGANMAVGMGLVPDAVIGDFDSILPATMAALPADRLHRIAEQDSTDFEKCLTRIAAPLILGVGLTAARFDHTLAVWNALTRHPSRRCVVFSDHDLAFLAPLRLRLDLRVGTRLSLFPMGAVAGAGTGLAWPIEGLDFAPDGRIGTSNQVAGPVDLHFTAARMLVIMPRACLPEVIAALTAPAHQAVPPEPADARGR